MSRGKRSFEGGVHPPERKVLAESLPVEVLPTPKLISVPLLQHLGAPCDAVVKNREEVQIGQVIGRSDAAISAPVHSSVEGTVAKASVTTLPNGRHVASLPIKVASEQSLTGRELFEDQFGGDWPTAGIDDRTPESIVEAVREAGLVGMGGAAFPTWVKLTRNPQRPVDTLLVNGCECEPYLAADNRLMIEAAAPVVSGALLAGRAAGAERIVVAIEDNKPDALAILGEAAAGTGIEVISLPTKYPQGAEKQLVLAVLGRFVPQGGLPLDVGVVVVNVATAASIARAVLRGKPLTHRIVTVSGDGIRTPKNVLVPIGTAYRDVIEFAGGLRDDAARVIAGGPMMGFTLGEFGVPVTKGTSGITVLTHGNLRQAAQTACVRCGRCVDVCPMSLVPTRIALAARLSNWDLVERFHADACMECGCCAFECPAQIPLVHLIRIGKVHLAA
jgi:electron transport complex protein RnfC